MTLQVNLNEFRVRAFDAPVPNIQPCDNGFLVSEYRMATDEMVRLVARNPQELDEILTAWWDRFHESMMRFAQQIETTGQEHV